MGEWFNEVIELQLVSSKQILRGTLNSTAWGAYRAHVSVNSVSILILKHRHGLVTDCHWLPIVPMVPIVPQSAPIESCRCIGQALGLDPNCGCCWLIGQALVSVIEIPRLILFVSLMSLCKILKWEFVTCIICFTNKRNLFLFCVNFCPSYTFYIVDSFMIVMVSGFSFSSIGVNGSRNNF